MGKNTLWLEVQELNSESVLKKSVGKTISVLLLCLCWASCGSAGNLTGNWQFTLKSSATQNTYTGTASITQSRNKIGSVGGTTQDVTGTVNFTNDPCATAAPLSGTITGPNVVFTLTEGGQPVSFTGSVNAAFTAMSGSYSAALGGCKNGDFGSWTAGRS